MLCSRWNLFLFLKIRWFSCQKNGEHKMKRRKKFDKLDSGSQRNKLKEIHKQTTNNTSITITKLYTYSKFAIWLAHRKV